VNGKNFIALLNPSAAVGAEKLDFVALAPVAYGVRTFDPYCPPRWVSRVVSAYVPDFFAARGDVNGKILTVENIIKLMIQRHAARKHRVSGINDSFGGYLRQTYCFTFAA